MEALYMAARGNETDPRRTKRARRKMAALKIPDEVFPALLRIAALESLHFDLWISALTNIQTKPSLDQVLSQLPKTLNGFQEGEVVSLIEDVVFPIYQLMVGRHYSAEKMAEDVAEAAVSQKPKEFSPDKQSLLKDRFARLLDFDSLTVVAKATEIRADNERDFCFARILSDIRPVFAKSTQSAFAGVIVHNLKIVFHSAGTDGPQEFYVAMDNNDIQQLKAVIGRAEQKTKALESILNNAGVSCIKE
jgi:hypothetical protein